MTGGVAAGKSPASAPAVTRKRESDIKTISFSTAAFRRRMLTKARATNLLHESGASHGILSP